MTFAQVFGGGTLAPADVAYRAVSLTANVTLVWPPLSTSATDFVARIMDVTPSAGSKTITMPPANQVSQGFDVLYANPSAFTYTVLDNSGSTIATVAASQYVYLFLTDNSTTAGTWKSFVYGVGTGAASAATLAGYGIAAISTTLNQSHTITTKSANYSVATTDRASVLVWTGGSGTFTLPLAANALQGFFFEVRNAGTGTLTLAAQGADTVDAAASIALQPTESLIGHSDGVSAWYSVGRGRATSFNFSQLTKAVAGGTSTLTTTEAANNIQTYTGILLSNQTIVVPAVVNVYYVSNQTTGAFSLTVQSPTPGTVVSVPTGQNAILVTDGTNVINASNTLSGLADFTLNAGTAAAPTLKFSGDTDTGLYRPVANTIGFAAGGAEVVRFKTTGMDTVDGTVALPSYSFSASLSTGIYSPAANQIAIAQNGVQALLVSGSQQVTMPNVNITGGVITGVQLLNLVRSARTSNTILAVSDSGKLIDITSGTFSQTFTAAATLGSGWNVYVRNSGAGLITLDPNGAELIDGLATFILYPGEVRLIQCDATGFYSVMIKAGSYVVTSTGPFVVPPGLSWLDAECFGGGGGGGGGCGGAAGTARPGASGAGGGARTKISMAGSQIPAAGTSITCTIGAGGTPGAGGSSANGSDGTAGGNTTFGSYLTSYGGGQGAGGLSGTDISAGTGGGSAGAGVTGSSSAALGGKPSIATILGGTTSGFQNNISGGGGASFNTSLAAGCAEYGGAAGGQSAGAGTGANAGGSSLYGGTGAGAGAGVSAANAASSAGTGGATASYTAGGGSAGGTSGATATAGTVGTNGTNGAAGSGGGGGGSAMGATGGAGGTGGTSGGGGGGGGGGTTAGGIGGAGGRGEIRITWG